MAGYEQDYIHDYTARPIPITDSWKYFFAASTSACGGLPMDFMYTEPKPVRPEFDRCRYCNIKALPNERLCVGCGAPL